MRGDLSEISAADACRDLARRRLSGALELDGPDGAGRVVFADGRVTAAVSPTPRARLGDRLVGAGLLDDDALTAALSMQADAPRRTRLGALLVDRGLISRDAVRLFVQEQLLDALFEINGWRYGTFEFTDRANSDVPEVPLELSVDDALVEVARRQHEWAELSKLIPDLEAVPVFSGPGSTASASLEPDEFAVLASVDNDRSIRELAADLGYGDFEAARIVYGLALLGVVEVRLPEDEVGAALDEAFSYFSEPATGPEPDTDDQDATGEDATGEDAPAAQAVDAASEEAAATEDHEGLAFTLDLPEGDLPVDEPMADAGSADERVSDPSHTDDLGAILTALRDDPHPGDRSAQDDGAQAAPGADPGAETDAGDVAETVQADEPASDAGSEAQPGSARAPADGGNVSEFLRELSRLAIDDPPPPKDPPRPPPEDPPPSRGPAPEDARKRKRGLFGWGS
jgi:hypothetical protein